MNNEFKSYTRKFMLFSAILVGVGSLLFLTVLKPYYSHVYPIIFVFISTVNYFGQKFIHRKSAESAIRYTNAYMIVVVSKMLIYLTFLLIVFFIDRPNVFGIALKFLLVYFCYLIFDIVQHLKISKK